MECSPVEARGKCLLTSLTKTRVGREAARTVVVDGRTNRMVEERHLLLVGHLRAEPPRSLTHVVRTVVALVARAKVFAWDVEEPIRPIIDETRFANLSTNR